MSDQPETWFTTAEVEAARRRLADNRYGGPDDLHDLDREDIHEIIRIVLTATWQSARQQGRTQATEGWEREWGVDQGGTVWVAEDEEEAREVAGILPDRRTLVWHLVGPWEPASGTAAPLPEPAEGWAAHDAAAAAAINGPEEPAEQTERCADCGLPVEETPTRRDKRHDHCGPGSHTGDPNGCERCA